MSVSRRHHYVPKMLSKRFADGNGHLWLFDRAQAKHGIRRVTPQGAFWSKDLNTQRHPTRPRDVSVEEHFAYKLEAPANQLLDQICGILRQGLHPIIEGASRQLLQHFIFYQLKRPPGAVTRMTGEPDIETAMKEVRQKKEMELGRSLTPEEIGDADTPQARQEIAANAKIVAVATPGEQSIRMLTGADLFFLLATRSAFAIGSHPVRILGKGQERNPVNANEPMLVLPIASDIAIAFGAQHRAQTILSLTNAQVRGFNNLAFEHGTAIAGNSAALVKPLIRHVVSSERRSFFKR